MSYDKHYLTNVILRVDFVSSEGSIKTELSSSVQNACVKYFPIPEERTIETQQVNINNSPAKQKTLLEKEQMKEWHYFGKDREKEICVAHNCIFVDFKQYESYSVFIEQFISVLQAFESAYPNVKINRIGLRYVDKIDLNGDRTKFTDWGSYWNKYIHSDLVRGLYFADDDSVITRVMSSIEMNYGDCMLRFNYGIRNEDYPAPNKKYNFILDTDVYSTGLYEFSEVSSKVDSFHHRAKQWFEKSIKSPLREKMGKNKNG